MTLILAIKTVIKSNATSTVIKHITLFSDSTRPLYQKKLSSVLAGDNGAEEANDTNGEIEEEEEEVAPTKAASRRVSTRSTRSNIAAAAAEFSADEEEAILEEEPVASEATEDDDSDEQPSVVVKEATPKPASNKSPLQALGQTIRQRFSGPSTTEQKSDRFTPTPRYVLNISDLLLKVG